MTYLAALNEHKAETDHIMARILESLDEGLAEDISAAYGYRTHQPETASAIAQLEESLSASVPLALRSLYLELGGIEIFDGARHLAVYIPTIEELLSKRTNQNIDRGWPSLYAALVTYGSRREFDGNLSPLQIENLKQHFVFGTVNHRYEDKTLFFFSAAGDLGKVRYEHEFSSEEWDAQYLPLCQGTMTPLSMDELLEFHVRACTTDLRQRWIEGNW